MRPRKRLHNEIQLDQNDCGDFDDPRYFRRLKRRRFVNESIRFGSVKTDRCIGGGILSKDVGGVDFVQLDDDDDDDDDDLTVPFGNSNCVTNNVIVTAVEEHSGDDAVDVLVKENGSLGTSSSNNNNLVADMVEVVGVDDCSMLEKKTGDSDDVDPDYGIFLNNNVADDNIENAGVGEVSRHDDCSMSTMKTDNSDYDDPDFKNFLDCVRPDGTSYMAEFPLDDGISQVVRYEDDRVDPRFKKEHLERAQHHTKKSKSFNRALSGRKAQHRSNAKKEKNFRSTWNVLCKKAKSSQINKKKRKAATPSTSGKHSNKSTIVEDKMKGNADSSADMTGKHATALNDNFGLCVKEELVDEAYEICLNPLKEDIEHVVSSTPINIMQGTTKVEQCCEDEDEVIIMDNDPFANESRTPFITSKSCLLDEDGRPFYEASTEGTNSQFTEGLLKMLERPYDEGEYEDLWKRVSECKPIERERNLRGSYKIYTAPGLGQSYLDKCCDLKETLDEAADDKAKQLKLLRGFFYWLQNTVVEGSFKPWLDQSCL